MPVAATQPATDIVIDRDRYRAARGASRKRSPDLFFAAHFTTKRRRYALLALDALVHQLAEIMGPPQVGAKPQAAVPAEAAGCCGGSGGSCEGESIAQRQTVCVAVIDHLYSGLDTGKPELDAFLDVNRSLELPREGFETMVEGMAAERTLPRYATWNRLSDVLGRCGGMRAMLTARVLMQSILLAPRDGCFSATAQIQLVAWGVAMRLCDVLQSVGEDYKHGRVLLPLDDLVKHRLSEKDIALFTEQGTTRGDERWGALMRFELDRVRNLFRGGAKAMSALADDGARRTFAAMGVFALRRLERLVDGGGDPFAMKVTMSTWQRMKAMPRAVRVVWEAMKVVPSSRFQVPS